MVKDTNEVVLEIFKQFLDEKRYRKTNERFAILKEIYARNDHFEADELYLTMKEKQFPVSRGTVYNTLEVLEECSLVVRHQFDNRVSSRYEKSYGRKQHDHLFCIDCKKITEFCDPRLHLIQTMVNDIFDCEIIHHSLTFYSNCKKNDCANKNVTLPEKGFKVLEN